LAIPVAIWITNAYRTQQRQSEIQFRLSDAVQQTGLEFPKGTRLLGMGKVDETLYVKVEFDRLQVAHFIGHNHELAQHGSSKLVHSMHDQNRLDWWHPSDVKVFWYWNYVDSTGDGIDVTY
jgi:hypothetical protein